MTPRPSRKAITRWAGAAVLLAAIGYLVGYVTLGIRSRAYPWGTGGPRVVVEFASPEIATAYVPLAMIEAGVCGQFVVTRAVSRTHHVVWNHPPRAAPVSRIDVLDPDVQNEH